MTESRRIDAPEPGCFRMRLVKGGWAVPCRIEFDEATGFWTATIDGASKSAADPVEAGVFRIWTVARRIEPWEYDDLIAHQAWCRIHRPADPCVNPHRPIDPMLLMPPVVPRSAPRIAREETEG